MRSQHVPEQAVALSRRLRWRRDVAWLCRGLRRAVPLVVLGCTSGDAALLQLSSNTNALLFFREKKARSPCGNTLVRLRASCNPCHSLPKGSALFFPGLVSHKAHRCAVLDQVSHEKPAAERSDGAVEEY